MKFPVGLRNGQSQAYSFTRQNCPLKKKIEKERKAQLRGTKDGVKVPDVT